MKEMLGWIRRIAKKRFYNAHLGQRSRMGCPQAKQVVNDRKVTAKFFSQPNYAIGQIPEPV